MAAGYGSAKPSTTAVFPDAGLAGENRVVLPAPHQDIDDLAYLLVASDDRIYLVIPGPLGEVHRKLTKSLLFAHLAGAMAPLVHQMPAAHLKSIVRMHGCFRRPLHHLGETVAQPVDADLLNSSKFDTAHCAGCWSSVCPPSGNRCGPGSRRTSGCRKPSPAR